MFLILLPSEYSEYSETLTQSKTLKDASNQ